MPLCVKHGQVYGEGGACATCEGKPLKHDTTHLPTQLSVDDRNAYEEALETLNQKVEDLTVRLEAVEAAHAAKG